MRGLYLLHIDGGNKASPAGEPSQGAYGFVLRDPKGNDLPGGRGKNIIGQPVRDPHSAEYEALLAGLAFARQQDIDYIAVFSDSRTVVNQVNGLWEKRNHLLDYCNKAFEALKGFRGWQMSWIPREWNKQADKLVEEAFAAVAASTIVHAVD